MRSKDFMKKNENAEPLELGEQLITPMAKICLHPQEVLAALWRHAREDLGQTFIPSSSNISRCGCELRRLVSNHRSSNGTQFQIITDTELHFTLIRLPKDEAEV